VMHAGWYSGGFTNIELPGASWSWGFDGNALYLQHVPEPSSLCLLGLGLPTLIYFYYRRPTRNSAR